MLQSSVNKLFFLNIKGNDFFAFFPAFFFNHTLKIQSKLYILQKVLTQILKSSFSDNKFFFKFYKQFYILFKINSYDNLNINLNLIWYSISRQKNPTSTHESVIHIKYIQRTKYDFKKIRFCIFYFYGK